MALFLWRRIRAALVFSGAALWATTAWPAERQVLQGHLPEAVAGGLPPVARLPAAQQLRLAIGLPLRNRPALTGLLQQLYDPASPLYHQYLAPEQFTARFGPAEKDYQALRRFAQSRGLTVTGTHPNRLVLDVTGTVENIEKAFHVQMRVYPHPTEPRTFYAPDVEPALDLDVPVLHIAGLSDYARPHPSSLHARPAAQPPDAIPSDTGSEGGLFIGLDFRAAYAPGVTLTGAGQSVALVEFDTYFASDISNYLALRAGGLANTSVTLTNVAIDQPHNTVPGSNTIEVVLDIDMAISMAPGLSNVFVYEAPNGDSLTPVDDLFNRIATDNSAQQISCSWSGFTDGTVEQVFLEFAAQGQSFFIASGDSGAYVNPQGNPDLAPVDNPYVTSVGGTTLLTSGARGAWASETTWSWFNSRSDGKTNGSTGGISPAFSIPSWQQPVSMAANQGSANYRNFPDVALTADQVYVIAGDGSYNVGGTSCAAPLWAGFMALVNEQNAAVGNAPAGFFNPALYALAQSAGYTNCFHDITTGNNTNLLSPNLYFAVPGYDLCTGWGTPAGSNLINALAVPADVLEITPNNSFSISATPGGPFGQAPRIFLLTNAGATALNWTLGNPAAWLTASPGAGALPAGGFANVTVSLNPVMAATLSLGLCSTNLWFTNQSDGVAQSRLFTLILAEPQLVQNGGFETGDFTGWTLVGDTIKASVIYDAVEDATNFPLAVHAGTCGACLGDDKLATLSQSLATVPGQSYLLSLWLDNPTNSPGQEFLVNWNTSEAATNTIYSISSPPAFGWTNLQFVLLAAGSGTVLEFGAQNDPPNYFGLDDVSVTPIPPPVFQSAASAGGAITLTWSALLGVSYQLQYTTSLSAPNWTNLGPPISAISGATAASDVQPADPQRFYRVVLAP
jgi:hypothetical protein